MYREAGLQYGGILGADQRVKESPAIKVIQATLSASGISARAASVPDSRETYLLMQDMEGPFRSDMVHDCPFRGQTRRICMRQTAVVRMWVRRKEKIKSSNLN